MFQCRGLKQNTNLSPEIWHHLLLETTRNRSRYKKKTSCTDMKGVTILLLAREVFWKSIVVDPTYALFHANVYIWGVLLEGFCKQKSRKNLYRHK